MTPYEQNVRMADAAAPPAQTAPASGTAPVEGVPAIPEDALILITTRNLVLFPGTVLPITLGRQRSIAAAQTAIRLNRPVGLVLQREAATEDPMPVDLHRVGTEANLLRYVTSPDGSHHVICQGEQRFRIIEFLDGYPFFVARIERVPETEDTSKEIDARLLNLRNQALEVLQLLPQICFIVKAAHFKERRLDEPYQVLDTAFLLGAIRPAQLHAYAHLQRGVSEDRIPFRHLAVVVPLQSDRLRSIKHTQQGTSAPAVQMLGQRAHQTFHRLIRHQTHPYQARVLQPGSEEMDPLAGAIAELHFHLPKIVLTELSGKTFEAN